MAQTTFSHGNPIMCDYTPGGAVAAGDVVVVGVIPCVAHRAIAANEKAAVAVGGGVYKCTADAALTAGAKVYWDDTANKVTATSASNKVFGVVAPGSSAAGDGDSIFVIHNPAF